MISALTGKNDARILRQVNPLSVAEKWRSHLSIDVGHDFRSLNSIEYLQCDITGFRWYSPPEAAGGAALYEQLEKFDWYYMKEKWEFDLAIKLLKNSKNILEVGVGEGNFLQLARNSGLDVEGVELNPKGAQRARDQGFQVHELTLEELSQNSNKRFDVICSFQVLEHVSDPAGFLRGMLGMLLPGGRLVLSVPNAAVMRKVDPECQDLLNQPPHHMGHWDEGVFRALELLLPLKVKSVHCEPLASYHVSWLVTGYLRNLLAPLSKKIVQFLVNRYSTLPLQWIMHAGLRKYFDGHTLLVELEYQPN